MEDVKIGEEEFKIGSELNETIIEKFIRLRINFFFVTPLVQNINNSLFFSYFNNSKKIILWLNKKSKSTKYDILKKQSKKIPINNLNKSKTTIYKIK